MGDKEMILPRSLSRGTLDSDLQNCVVIRVCQFKPQRLASFVTAAKVNSHAHGLHFVSPCLA